LSGFAFLTAPPEADDDAQICTTEISPAVPSSARASVQHHDIECEREAMPKNKTHSGTKKRVKVTGTGKLTHAGSGKRHNLENKPTSRTRRLDGAKEIAKVDAPRIRRLLGI
jgi:large subunit ribosomal protein L35